LQLSHLTIIQIRKVIKNELQSNSKEKIIGIDLGTTNSAAAVIEAGRLLPSKC